jgi:hypothetical protein
LHAASFASLDAGAQADSDRLWREDFDFRDDANWLCWIDVREAGGTPQFTRTPIPMPVCSPGTEPSRPVQRVVRGAVGTTG